MKRYGRFSLLIWMAPDLRNLDSSFVPKSEQMVRWCGQTVSKNKMVCVSQTSARSQAARHCRDDLPDAQPHGPGCMATAQSKLNQKLII